VVVALGLFFFFTTPHCSPPVRKTGITACMKALTLFVFLLSTILALADPSASPSATAPDSDALKQLLKEFLDGAGRNDLAVHERFWADELIYTSSAGKRLSKADILRDIKAEAAAPKKPEQSVTTYSAEDVRVLQYGNTAVVAFHLVATIKKESTTEVTNYFNTGTFVKRDNKWQAVAWQATKIPAEPEPKK
jgi:ketosteroid isomerase-like protein